MVSNIIETFNLTKKYPLKHGNKEIIALNNINISIKEGEKFGLLGPNGAGKTTLIQILTTLKQPTSGYATIDGYNVIKKPNEAKRRIALMLESSMLYYRITGYDNLKFFCKMYNISNYKEKINNISKEFGLERWLNQLVERYSSGMFMKLALCRTLLLDRKILILDEPTLGLDVQTKSFIMNKLKYLDKTILITSHDIPVVEKLCDRIAFINKGNIVKIGTKDDIKRFKQTEIIIEVWVNENKNELKNELNQQEFVKELTETKDSLIINLKDIKYHKDLFLILGKFNIYKIRGNELSLEDLFLKITNY